jgi:alkylated DNA repair dioxygenase AlkB
MRRIELSDGAYLELTQAWLSPAQADQAFATLQTEVDFQARAIRIFGREVLQPRLVCWIGDADALYTYSGVQHVPEPWTPTLRALRDRLGRELALPFNSVLCNLYRDGRDSMGMHSDSEPELGKQPVVASLSLGATRKLVLRPKKHASGVGLDLPLEHGALLVMRGTTQQYYRHGIPKQTACVGARINLTFRRVQSA